MTTAARQHGRLLARRACRNVPRRDAYLLLETVIATALLVIGLAVIGAQVQEAEKSVRRMQLQSRAMLLGEQYLAEMDLGLIELDSLDELQEEDFGPRFPDFGWRLLIQETSTEKLYLLTLEVLYMPRENYDEEEFDFDHADVVYTLHAIRATPEPVSLGTEFGLTEEELIDADEKLELCGIDGLSAENFDISVIAKMDVEQMMTCLPVVLELLGADASRLLEQLPPEVRENLEKLGVGEEEQENGPPGDGAPGDGNEPEEKVDE